MTTHEKARELIERYLYTAGEELPRKQRDDVKAELRSLLEDAIEERASAGNRPFDEELAVEVLREFGKPEEVAARYQPPGQYLIGPKLFPTFLVTAKIVLVVVAAIYLWSVGLAMFVAPSGRMPEMFRPSGLWGLVASFLQLAFVNLAILVVVFAVIERFSGTHPLAKLGCVQIGVILAAKGKGEPAPAEWDPRKLPAIPTTADRDRISFGQRVFGVYAILALAVWVNLFPETFGLWIFAGDQVRTMRFADMGLRFPVALMNIWWALALTLNMWLLRVGRWTRESRWAEFALGIFGGLILYFMLASGGVEGSTGPWRDAWSFGPFGLLEAARENLHGLGWLLHILLTWVLFFTAVEALIRLYRILRRYPWL